MSKTKRSKPTQISESALKNLGFVYLATYGWWVYRPLNLCFETRPTEQEFWRLVVQTMEKRGMDQLRELIRSLLHVKEA